ncbi:catechol 1,2-dioxygenase [Pseudonocardia sediminis]|uniref:Catechol 1,2-dioxygenase n=1 Tax=Pseudonocardia sediminis TaxID=1397368 RepID=A0A4Q7UQB8_PSEST|nr:dioxygenase [Pseudonocardia sediminis]RZT83244.1 catechol 1,2-dioxygenase [Pseudonocardia sediminis]
MTTTDPRSGSAASDAATAGSHATESARLGRSNQRGGGSAVDQARTAKVIGAALEGIRAAIRDNKVTYDEFDAFKRWLIEVSDTGEWPLFLDVYLEFEVERVAAETQDGSTGTILGPFWLDGQAQLDSPATLPMRDDEPGTPLILAGQVRGTDGKPLAGAKVDIWHTDDEGYYSGFASKPPAGNLRGVVTANSDGRYEIHSRKPAPYTIPLDGPTGKMTETAGWSPWRPGHLHLLVSAPGHRTITTQLFFIGDRYLDSDVASATKPELILDPQPTGNGDEVRSDYDFVIESE